VANVPAGEKVEVTLGYQELVGYDDGEWRFVFPMVAPDRFPLLACEPAHGAGDRGREAVAKVRPPRPASNDRAGDVSLTLEVRAAPPSPAPPASPSHRVLVESVGAHEWKVKLHPGERLPNRDFVLAGAARTRGVRPARLLRERKPDKVGTFLLVVTPPVAEPPAPARPTPGRGAAPPARSSAAATATRRSRIPARSATCPASAPASSAPTAARWSQ
jgi:hypothetical protein